MGTYTKQWVERGGLLPRLLLILIAGLTRNPALLAQSPFAAPGSYSTSPSQGRASAGQATVSGSCEQTAPPLDEARSLLRKGNAGEAGQIVRPYLLQHPDSASAHFLLGHILFAEIHANAVGQAGATGARENGPYRVDSKFAEENARASLAEFTEGARHCTPSALDLKIVALDYVVLGSFADADKWLTRSLAWNPADAEGWYYLGRAKYNENRFLEAVAAFKKCLELEPRNGRAQDNLGLSYAGLGNNSQAIAAIETAIAWQADSQERNPEPYVDLGDLLLQLGKTEEAERYLVQAVEIDTRNGRAREFLGKAYLSMNQLPKAQTELETAIALAPENASLHYLLGQVYRKEGLLEKAKLEFARFEAMKSSRSTSADPRSKQP
jgi:tetratricopeptide (TPR) repeat protein